jgi:hypothetical protein
VTRRDFTVTSLSVIPNQLTSAAEAVRTLAEQVKKDPTLGYEVQPTRVGGEPLASAMDELQQECRRAVTALVADLMATADGLRTTATRYVATDEAVAEVISSLGDR